MYKLNTAYYLITMVKDIYFRIRKLTIFQIKSGIFKF